MQNHPSQSDHSLYSNAFGFLRQPVTFNPMQSHADIIILGLPFDMATTGRPGSRMGPKAIRQASVNLHWEEQRWPWPFKLCRSITIEDCGDLIFSPGDAEDFTQKAEAYAREIIQSGKALLSLGGDHYATLPLLRAHHKQYGKMALIHFDAHTDTYSAGSRYDHGTMFYHAPQEGLIDTNHSIQIGIRTEYEKNQHPFQVIDAAMANDMSAQEVVAQIKARVADLPVYLTFDIDCLDPAFAPGTGTPVCGGLTSDMALKIIRGLTDINLVGMDVVEVAPCYDSAEITALAGATLALEMLHLWAINQGFAKQ